MTTQLFCFPLTICILAFCEVLCVAVPVAAQQAHLADVQHAEREFHDSDGDVFVKGILYGVSGDNITIMASDGSSQSFNINKFCDEDRSWIRKTVSEHKKFLKKKKMADEVIEELRSVQSSRIIKACRRLKSFGSAASHAGPRLVPLFQSQDDKVVLAAFICYSNTAQRNKDSINRMIRELMDPQSKVLRIVKQRPEKFLETLPRYEELAIPYLRAIAYRCQLDTKPVKHSADPQKLTLTGGKKNDLRAQACRTIAKIKLDVSSEILLRVLKVSDEGPPKQRDENTIKETIAALGELGIDDLEVTDAIESYEAEFPDVVREALEHLK